MKIHGKIFYSGLNFDDDGHTDDYDLMFASDDGHIELCLNGFENAVVSPLSVHDTITGTLELTCTEERINKNTRA